MDRRTAVLLGLIGVLVVSIFVLGIAVQGGDDGDPSDSATAEVIDDLLGGIGFGRRLGADDVEAACFDGDRFETAVPCSFRVPERINRAEFTIGAGLCRVDVTDQPDVLDQHVDNGDARDGRLRLALSGDGAVITISAPLSGSCVLGLAG